MKKLSLIFLMGYATCGYAYADDCTISSGTLRGGTISPANSASTTHVYSSSQVTHGSIVSCIAKTGSSANGTMASSLSLTGSNIDTSSSTTYNSTTYYKIVNTGNEFLDNFGYIYFKVTDNNSSSSPSTTLPTMVSNSGLWTIYSAAVNHPTQGLKFTPAFYFSKVPTSTITQSIIFGTLNANVTYSGTTYSNSPLIYSTVTFTPVSTNTCSVQDTSVTLPTVNVSALSTSGSEAGRTGFTVSATCSSGLASTSMSAVMLDTNNVSNSTTLLTNTGTATDVSVKVYDSSNTPITLGGSGNSFTFGTTSSGSTPTVSKKFAATYYRNGSTTLSAGTVSAKATVSLFYN